MKKRKVNKKNCIIAFTIVLITMLGIIYTIIYKTNNEKIPILKKDLNFEINTEVYLLSLIDEKNQVEISSENELIDTSKLGVQKLTLKYKINNQEKKYIFKINIVDTIAPTIEYKETLMVVAGTDTNLLKDVKATDNSKEDIKVTVEGKYDINKEGNYNLKYIAIDSSNNKTEEEFTLQVTEKNTTTTTNANTNTYTYPKIPEPTGEKELIGTSSKGWNIYKINGSVYIDEHLIANKTYALAENFIPTDTYKSAVGIVSKCNTCINNTAYKAWLDMKADATALGLNIWIQSGYRPYTTQVTLYDNYIKRDGKEKADTYSSRPGHSEHQTGLSFDLNSISDAFANTQEGRWVNENAHKYGYIIRFPKGKEDKTGYKYESWHLRYVGTELSYKLYNNGDWISLEEYFGITSEYAD